MEYDKQLIRVYNPAKSVIDCFKYRNKIGLDVALEALREVRVQKKATVDELWHFAKVCRVTNIIRYLNYWQRWVGGKSYPSSYPTLCMLPHTK